MKITRLLLAGMAPMALLVGIASSVSAQEPPKDISGRVVNGTAGIEAMEVEEVALRVFLNGEIVDFHTAAPDSDGRFLFHEVPQEGNFFYLLTATYLDIPYQVELSPESELSDVRLTVYESGAALEEITLTGWSLFILAADSGARSLSALEVVTVVNRGDRVFIPDLTNSVGMAFLRFPLFQKATNLEVESELPQGQVLQVDQGFAITTPVPPGAYGIAFTYTIPYSGTELDLSRIFRLGTGTFRLLVPEDLASVSMSGLNNLGITAIGESIYQVYGATSIGRDGEIAITLADLPQPSAWQRLSGWLRLGSPAEIAIPGIFAVALVLLLIVKAVRRGPAKASDDLTTIEDDRISMTRSIADLDNRSRRGDLPEEQYRQQRQELKARLLRLVWQESLPE